VLSVCLTCPTEVLQGEEAGGCKAIASQGQYGTRQACTNGGWIVAFTWQIIRDQPSVRKIVSGSGSTTTRFFLWATQTTTSSGPCEIQPDENEVLPSCQPGP
jgi:hypothetical protein